MTSIAKVMQAQTVAEHVENDLIAQRMRHYDIDFIKGFAVGKPVPLGDVLRDIGPNIMLDDEPSVVAEPLSV
jgi:EAL domain-containing protein (putative c-di-GMP-specific phosphodiesterase class I)